MVSRSLSATTSESHWALQRFQHLKFDFIDEHIFFAVLAVVQSEFVATHTQQSSELLSPICENAFIECQGKGHDTHTHIFENDWHVEQDWIGMQQEQEQQN